MAVAPIAPIKNAGLTSIAARSNSARQAILRTRHHGGVSEKQARGHRHLGARRTGKKVPPKRNSKP